MCEDDTELFCVECGDECDGSFTNSLNEPLCSACAEDLGYGMEG